MKVWKMTFLFKEVIFGFLVHFPGRIQIEHEKNMEEIDIENKRMNRPQFPLMMEGSTLTLNM